MDRFFWENLRESFFGYRQLKVAKMGGRRPKKYVQPHGNAAPEPQTIKTFKKSPDQKKGNFRPTSPPSKRTGGLMGTKKSFPKKRHAPTY